jgi:hypothetical protein
MVTDLRAKILTHEVPYIKHKRQPLNCDFWREQLRWCFGCNIHVKLKEIQFVYVENCDRSKRPVVHLRAVYIALHQLET